MSEVVVERMNCWTFRLPTPLLKQARAISAKTGVPMSRIARDGLKAQIEKYDPRAFSKTLRK